MEHAKTRFKDAFTMTSYMLLVVISLPLLAIAAFTARFVVLGVLLLALPAGILAYAMSPKVRAWFGEVEADELRYSGLRLASDVALHPGHAWARRDDGGVTVGADDLVQSVVGPIEEVVLPAKGQKVRRGDPLFTVRHGGRSVTLRSPVSGTVERTNDALARSPGLVNGAPFDAGWAVRLSAPAARSEMHALLRGGRAKTWFRGEVDRLFEALQPASAVPALPDGGLLVRELHRHIDDAAWDRIHKTIF